jgi:hypothetical protein
MQYKMIELPCAISTTNAKARTNFIIFFCVLHQEQLPKTSGSSEQPSDFLGVQSSHLLHKQNQHVEVDFGSRHLGECIGYGRLQ